MKERVSRALNDGKREAWEIWGKSAPEKECSMQGRCELAGLSKSKVTKEGAEGDGADGQGRKDRT